MTENGPVEAQFVVAMNPPAPIALVAEIPHGAVSVLISMRQGDDKPLVRIDTFGPSGDDEGMEFVAEMCDMVAEFLRQPDTRAHAIMAAASNTIRSEGDAPHD